MIDLVSKDGKKLTIQVLDYEFPDRKDTGGIPTEEELAEMENGRDYDANWLNIKVDGTNGDTVWSVVDPCLLTWELETLMDWFVRMADSIEEDNISPSLFFLEPCFSVYKRQENDNEYRIRFALSFELAPPGEFNGAEYYMDFVLTKKEIGDMANSIAMTLAQYPAR